MKKIITQLMTLQEKSMHEYKSIMSQSGRIVIPAKCREALQLAPGEVVIIRVEGNEAKICSAKFAMTQAQKIVSQAMKGKKSLVEELIKSRRAEAKNE